MLVACAPSEPQTTRQAVQDNRKNTIFPDFLPDPFEPVNRGLWGLNRGLLVGVIQPTGRVYRTVVPPPARQSIQHFSRNITYPGRLINHALQGRWDGAGDESLRFLCNTTAGIGGFFDVATRWNIPKSEADFGQTFSRWGWQPSSYVMLPFLGPSDDSHALGLALDKAAEPLTYASHPYSLASPATTYNRLTETTEENVRFIHSEADAYVGVKYAWTYASRDAQPDWQTKGAKDMATLETLGVAQITTKDPEFRQHGREMSVRLPSTGRRMPFNCWLQRETAPLVFITPGLGSHRLSLTTLSLAEHLYQNGFSVVTVSSVFHPEFMEHASTVALPAYPPTDSQDMLVTLTEIDRSLQKKHPGKFAGRALIGCSMGAYQALYLAAHETRQPDGMLRFDRYVAIDTPVDLHHGVACIDRFHNAPMAWPASERQSLINNAVHKGTKMGALRISSINELPFDGIESKFLIGLTFKLTLRDAIFSSQSRHDMGLIRTPISYWRRESVYQEIQDCTFEEYFSRFVVPYYHERGINLDDFTRETNLRNHEKGLRAQSKVRVLINRNDFLLTPGDIGWLESTLGASRLKVFPNGGHLGNLASGPVQAAVIDSLKGLE